MSDTPIPPSSGPLDKLKGKAKAVAGSVLGNDTLATEGKLEQDAAAKSDEARQQAAAAAQAEAKAEVEGAVHANAVETQRIEAERLEVERAAQIDREREMAEAQTEAVHDRRETQVEQQAELDRQAAAREANDAVGDRVSAEQDAARLEAQAKAARNAAETLDTNPSA